LSGLSDEEIVALCLKGSGRAVQPYGLLVKRYDSLVYRVCFRYFKNQEIAEDLTQETFLKAYNKLSSLESGAKFKSWLVRIATRICTDCYRKRKRRAEIQAQVASELSIQQQISSKEENSDHSERSQKLVEALETLTESDRSLIVMYYFSEMTIKDIAEEFEIGESAVKMRLSRARTKIEEKVKNE